MISRELRKLARRVESSGDLKDAQFIMSNLADTMKFLEGKTRGLDSVYPKALKTQKGKAAFKSLFDAVAVMNKGRMQLEDSFSDIFNLKGI